ncbi:hypothetical protein N8314_00710 [Akkermansiaceae bacterium]|nr:hypothetical protein [Akkermansiaceae bacterium]
MPKGVWFALLFTILAWSWMAFKKYEPILMPVLRDFQVDEVWEDSLGTHITGTFRKVRDCEFIEVIPYSGGYRIDIDTPDYTILSRPKGFQRWYWLVYPPIPSMEIYTTHECSTGRVTSLVFKGRLKTKARYSGEG